MNFKKLLHLLHNQNLNASKNAQQTHFDNKNLVLVLGNTMAGKSTLINYFLNNLKVEINEETLENYYERIDAGKGPQIGHIQDVSQTKTIEPYECRFNDYKIYLCDFPGFFNTDDLEENVALGLSIQYLMRNFTHFMGILVVVSEDDLRAARAMCFKQLLTILKDLFTSLDSIKDSLLFIFNKSKNGKSVELCKTIKNAGKEEATLLNLITSVSNERSFTRCVKSFEDNCSIKNEIFDYLFDSTSKQRLHSISSVNFNNYDRCLKEFNELLEDLVKNDLNRLFQSEIDLRKNLIELDRLLDEMNRRKRELRIEIKKCEEHWGSLNMDDFVRQIVQCEVAIKSYQEISKDKKTRLDILNEECDKLERLLRNYENDDLIEHQHDEFEEHRSCLELLAWSKHTFEYNNADIPFVKAVVKFDTQDGSLSVCLNKPQFGRYKAVYESKWKKNGMASLILHFRKRHFYKDKIEHLKFQLMKNETEKNFLKDKIDEFEYKIIEHYERKVEINSQKIRFEQIKLNLKNLQEELLSLEISITNSMENKFKKMKELDIIKAERMENKHDLVECVQFLLENFKETYLNGKNSQIFIHFKNLIQEIILDNKRMYSN